ncbi:RidA family protein [Actinospica sp.]|uniref:RidA family protein n=1 Tax=Actinospica sp. TaxID=1872142 RepID=UPI002CBFAEBB|nr:RidA family protein [Actinospica sp.]HWG25578.1 RidA family protein [Actinospica sp.]
MSSLPVFREVFESDEPGSRVVALRSGPLVHVPRLLPSVAAGSPLADQLESVLERMRSIVREAGGGLDDIARVTLFMREVKDRRTLNDVWTRWFPDSGHRPPHKYVPADIPGGYAVMVDALAVLGGERKTLKIAGVEHRDPMAMGARKGQLVCSSRLFTAEQSPGKQFSVLLEQARALMAEAGGDLSDLTQVTVFAPTREAATSMELLCRAHWADSERPPDLHVLVADLGGTGTCRIEVIGVLPDPAPSPAGG